MIRFFRQIIRSILYRLLYIASAQKSVCFIYGKASNKFGNINTIKSLIRKDYDISVIRYGEKYLSAIKKIARAKIIIQDQASFYLRDIRLGKRTICIQVWHACGAFKKVGFDAKIKNRASTKEEKRILRIHNNIHYFVCTSAYVAKIYSRAFRLSEEQMLVFGLPRMDAYFAEKNIAQNTNDKIIVLYAPTFRTSDSGGRIMPDLPSAEYMMAYFKNHNINNIILAYKSHPSVEAIGNVSGWADWSHLDQRQALSKTSILITDYSSIFFDYLVYRRHIIFYHVDKKEYQIKQRELYFDPKQYSCFSVCSDIEQLCRCIVGSIDSKPDYDEFWSLEMGACDGKSSQRICNFISKIMKADCCQS